jgi:protein SCO1/2
MKNKSYIGISLIILIFGIIFIPKIIDRISKGSVVDADTLNINKEAAETGSIKKCPILNL